MVRLSAVAFVLTGIIAISTSLSSIMSNVAPQSIFSKSLPTFQRGWLNFLCSCVDRKLSERACFFC